MAARASRALNSVRVIFNKYGHWAQVEPSEAFSDILRSFSRLGEGVTRTAAALVALLALLTTGSPAQTLETLHLLASPVDDVMPVLYAQRAGLFAHAGLNVVLDRANNGGAVAAAIAGGSTDIGKGDIGMIILAHAHDVPLVILAPAAVYDPRTPDCVLLVPASSAIRSPRDLVGKTIGVASLNSVMTVATQAWLDASGVSWASTQFVEIPYSQMGLALARARRRDDPRQAVHCRRRDIRRRPRRLPHL